MTEQVDEQKNAGKVSHTPGPWKVNPAPHFDVWAAECKVANMHNFKQAAEYRVLEDAERLANARLIAEAPVMADVLLRFCAALDGDRCDYDELAADARAALSRAGVAL